MLIEQVLFHTLAVILFVVIFFKLIKRNDTNYLAILIPQTIGIAINFFYITLKIFQSTGFRVITYILSIILPILILILEKKYINFSELIYIMKYKIYNFTNNEEKAKNILLKLINKYPNTYLGHKYLAKFYEKSQNYLDAIDEYINAVNVKENDYETIYTISSLFYKIDKKDDSIHVLNDLLKQKPDYTEASELLGEILCEKEDFKEAINIYAEALKYHPENYNLYYGLGIAYTRLNDFQTAENYYRKAAKINSLLYKANYNLGQIALLANELDEAEEQFRKCIDEEDFDAEAYFQLARISIKRNDKEMAINYLNIALEIDCNIIKKIDEETIFIIVRKNLKVPKSIENSLREKNLKDQEIKAIEHLDKMYTVSDRLDFKIANFKKEKNIEIEEKTENREKEE